MITELKEHFRKKSEANTYERKEWFTEEFTDLPDMMSRVSGEQLNNDWMAKYTDLTTPTKVLMRLQSFISRLATLRKAVVEQYVSEGIGFQTGIDAYRYNTAKNVFVTASIPSQPTELKKEGT